MEFLKLDDTMQKQMGKLSRRDDDDILNNTLISYLVP